MYIIIKEKIKTVNIDKKKGRNLYYDKTNSWKKSVRRFSSKEGKKAQSLKVGDVVAIPANVKHWHGAKKDSWFSHIAVEALMGMELKGIDRNRVGILGICGGGGYTLRAAQIRRILC